MSGKSALVAKLMLSAAFALTLSGCVVAIGDKSDHSNEQSWKKVQQSNLQQINQLTLGVSAAEVKTLLGAPDFSEVFQKDGEQIQVLFYRTHHVNSDNKTTKEECTPLIFKANILTGWGDKAYAYL